jgi:hypothetical protein
VLAKLKRCGRNQSEIHKWHYISLCEDDAAGVGDRINLI